MEYLPFLLVGVAILILGVVGAVVFHNERLKRRVITRAKELLRQGAPPAEAQQQLLGEGLDAEQAAKVVLLAARRIHVEDAVEMLEAGKTEDELLAELQDRGLEKEDAEYLVASATFQYFCRRHPVLTPALGIVLPILGAAAFVGGLLLWVGNKSGRFVTFPFAGQIVMALGLAVLAAGGAFFLRAMSF